MPTERSQPARICEWPGRTAGQIRRAKPGGQREQQGQQPSGRRQGQQGDARPRAKVNKVSRDNARPRAKASKVSRANRQSSEAQGEGQQGQQGQRPAARPGQAIRPVRTVNRAVVNRAVAIARLPDRPIRRAARAVTSVARAVREAARAGTTSIVAWSSGRRRERRWRARAGRRSDRSPARGSASGPTGCATSRSCSTIRNGGPRPLRSATACGEPARNSDGTPRSPTGTSSRTWWPKPINELRHRIGEEVRRRESPDALVPIDRDPVPPQFAEGVRRYYERLGSGR